MVSQSSVSRKHPLIFISCGTTDFAFDRLFRYIKQAPQRCLVNRKIVLQSRTNTLLRAEQQFASISETALINYFKKSTYCIVHGGPISIYLAAKYCPYMPYIIPRVSRYGEHVDDHQIFYCKALKYQLPQTLKKTINTDPNQAEKECYLYLGSPPFKNRLAQHLYSKSTKDSLGKSIAHIIES